MVAVPARGGGVTGNSGNERTARLADSLQILPPLPARLAVGTKHRITTGYRLYLPMAHAVARECHK